MSEDHNGDVDETRHFDPERGAFDPPDHPPLRNPDTNPRGVRHINETAQDHMAVPDRPRYQAAQRRRSSMITTAMRRLRGAGKGRGEPSRTDPEDPTAA